MSRTKVKPAKDYPITGMAEFAHHFGLRGGDPSLIQLASESPVLMRQIVNLLDTNQPMQGKRFFRVEIDYDIIDVEALTRGLHVTGHRIDPKKVVVGDASIQRLLIEKGVLNEAWFDTSVVQVVEKLRVRGYRPATLVEILCLAKKYPEATSLWALGTIIDGHACKLTSGHSCNGFTRCLDEVPVDRRIDELQDVACIKIK